MKSLEKLQSLSLEKRKIVLWVSVGIIGLIFLSTFFIITSARLRNVNFQDLKEQSNIPSIEMPNFNE
jgi:hypothetical protein